MESEQSESPIQLSLRRNRVKCLDLNYAKIASFLISKDVLHETQHSKFKNDSTDSVGRMDNLLSFLYKLNSEQAFNLFRDVVIICGEMDLAESLRICETSSLPDVPITQGDHKIHCLQIPEIVSRVFGYLPAKELLNLRPVCRTWNGVVIEFYSSSFVVQLKKPNNSKPLAEYIEIASNSAFCKAISNYSLGVKQYLEAEKEAWKTILEKFGNNIKSLTLLPSLNKDIVELILSSDYIHESLKNLTKLHLNASLAVPFVARTSFIFFLQLKHLTVGATRDSSEYGQIGFITKFVKLEHQLESLVLRGHYCAGELSSKTLQNVFRTNTIESLEVTDHPAPFLDDRHFKAMTSKKTESKLKSIKFDKMCLNSSSTAFHQFLVSHRHSLERITCSQDCMENLPTLDRLTYLNSGIHIGSEGLSFCTQFSNLKVLKLDVQNRRFVVKSSKKVPFEHKALRFLYLWSLDGSIISLIAEIPSHFPNLRKLELWHRSGGILPLYNVGKLQHQVRNDGNSVWISTSAEIAK